MSKSRTLSSQADRATKLMLGTKKHYPDASAKLNIGGATFTVDAWTTFLQDFVNARQAVEASKAATKAKLDAARAQAPSQIASMNAFERIVRGTFGASADALADFGLALPKVRAPLSAEQKAAAVAKRAATRAARGTVGKNKKLPLRRGTSGIRPRFALRSASAASR